LKILEFESKALMKLNGLPVPVGKAVKSAEDVRTVSQEIGCPVMVKAQIPANRRQEAGGVQFGTTPENAAEISGQIIGNEIGGYIVETVLVEKRLETSQEVFLAITYEPAARSAILLASINNGVEVERGAKVVRIPFSTTTPVPDYLGQKITWQLGFSGSTSHRLSKIINQLTRKFLTWDAILLEINPLILDQTGQWWIADVHMELDDDAFYRQTELFSHLRESLSWANRQSEFERLAVEIDSVDHRGVAGRLVAFGGDLGLLIGGGGASLTIFDTVLECGLTPANYCEVGGNPSVWKIKELTKLILSQPQVNKLAVIMNVVNNTRVDLMARGVIKGVVELGRDPKEVIVAFRVPGSWEAEGRKILEYYGIPFYGRDTTLDQVIEIIKWQF
jgi:succinyl-CoA synthetase beta subunit